MKSIFACMSSVIVACVAIGCGGPDTVVQQPAPPPAVTVVQQPAEPGQPAPATTTNVEIKKED